MENKEILIILFFAFLIRLIFVFSTPLKIWDETVYANLGYDLSKNLFDYSIANKGWSDYIPSRGDEVYSWPKMGFRAPLLPYLLSILYFLKLDYLVDFFMPLIGLLSVFALYLLGKEMFNKKVSLYSATFLAFLPLHVYYSTKILTDVIFTFFLIISFIAFWKGFEKNDNKYKIYFGLLFALSLLSRYTALWFIPIFFVYLYLRYRSFVFLRDKYLWYSVSVFFLTLVPWLVYGIYSYSNPLGPFIHGFKASSYWGGFQPWFFFFKYWGQIFSIGGFVFLIALADILFKKEFFKKELYILITWFFFFLAMAIYMPHKKERFLLAISPTIALIIGYFTYNYKKYSSALFFAIIVVNAFHLGTYFYYEYKNSYTDRNLCFLEAAEFISRLDNNSVVITDETAVIYYYTKFETKFYPNPWSFETLINWKDSYYSNKNVYFLFGDFIIKSEEEYKKMKEDLEINSEKVFECSKKKGNYIVFKI